MMTNPAKRTPRGRKRQRGAALAVTGIAMLFIVGMAVVGVDVGHLAFTANETQALADLSATSYVKTLALNLDDGGSRDPVAQTAQVVSNNFIGGVPATVADNIASFEPGSYDVVTRSFTPGGTPVTAVRATAVATVPNFFAGIYGDLETTVTRQATAALTPPGRAPVLPLAIGECHWDIFENTGDCSAQPQFSLIPSTTDNSCWTGLTTAPGDASNNNIRDIIRAYCSGASSPRVGRGDDIYLDNGKKTPLLNVVQECLDAGVNEFVVPVVECNNCTGASEILGFATITVTSVVATGAGASTGLYADAVCSTNPPGATGGGGGANTGTIVVTMVQ